MSGIYIHIPFCKQACYYCNFHFSTSLKLKDEMLFCLNKEIQLHQDEQNSAICGMILPTGSELETIYFGGGTPSILPADDIAGLIQNIRRSYAVAEDAEITLEANPDDITLEKLRQLRAVGVNRLSIGVQSFVDRDLKWMNRVHDSNQAVRCLEWAKEAGFHNFSVDLIFGTPNLTDDEWNENIDKVIRSGAPHIACYALTVEPKTALFQMIRLGKKEDVNQEDQARQFEILMQRMRSAGYEHYEVSNFALPGMRSRHNSSYWQGKKYLGIGPSAHSYDGRHRYWNKANNPLYIKSVVEQQPFFEKENLTDEQRVHEYILTSLRTMEGLDLNYIGSQFGNDQQRRTEEKINILLPEWYRMKDGKLALTDKGILFADRISVELFD